MGDMKLILLILGAVLLIIGAAVAYGRLKKKGIDITSITKISTVTNTYFVDAPFAAIAADDAAFSVRILPSEDRICRVKCKGSKKLYHVVTIEGDTLIIRREDKRKWYDRFGLQLEGAEIVMLLPVGQYRSLRVATPCGRIEVAKPFTFNDVELSSADGSIVFEAMVEERLLIQTASSDVYVSESGPRTMNIQTRSGSVTVDAIRSETNLNINTTSGDITLADIRCRKAVAETSGGKITFTDLVASVKIRIRSAAGDVELSECDAESLKIKTVAGDVTGTLLSQKEFVCKTTAGEIEVPEGSTGGLCKIKTVSGDVSIKIDYSKIFR